MQISKDYGQIGLKVGAIIYAIFILVSILCSVIYKSGNPDATLAYIGVGVVIIFFWTLIPLGFLIGWLYGKIKSKISKTN
ncbi:MAG: hypothetical protein V4524_03880 [Patescibacteria group bacterium]